MIRNSRHIIIPSGWMEIKTPKTAAVASWWVVAGKTCVAAYQPKGAASLAASYSNLQQPGTYDAAPGVAPTWAAGTGWTFDGSSQYLRTGVIEAANTWSMIVRVANIIPAAGNHYILAAASGTNKFFALLHSSTSCTGYNNGSGSFVHVLANETLGCAAQNLYLNGNPVAVIAAGVSPPSVELYIGTLNYLGAPQQYFKGDVVCAAIYSMMLTGAEMLTVHTAMAAL